MAELAQKHQVKVIGLHAHLGSGVLDATSWYHTARLLAKLAKSFSGVKYLNLGGGFGVPENTLVEAN